MVRSRLAAVAHRRGSPRSSRSSVAAYIGHSSRCLRLVKPSATEQIERAPFEVVVQLLPLRLVIVWSAVRRPEHMNLTVYGECIGERWRCVSHEPLHGFLRFNE